MSGWSRPNRKGYDQDMLGKAGIPAHNQKQCLIYRKEIHSLGRPPVCYLDSRCAKAGSNPRTLIQSAKHPGQEDKAGSFSAKPTPCWPRW
jgi:hypothetical protein